jgi:hypothetical protein
MTYDAAKSRLKYARFAMAYRFAAAISLGTFLTCMLAAEPSFLKLFVPYPSLENAEHIVGRIEFKNKFKSNLQLFIVTEFGKKHLPCSHFGVRSMCSEYNDGAQIELWYHSAFGIIQYKFLKKTDSGSELGGEYSLEQHRAYFENDFSVVPYVGKLFTGLMVLALMVWQIGRIRQYAAWAK